MKFLFIEQVQRWLWRFVHLWFLWWFGRIFEWSFLWSLLRFCRWWFVRYLQLPVGVRHNYSFAVLFCILQRHQRILGRIVAVWWQFSLVFGDCLFVIVFYSSFVKSCPWWCFQVWNAVFLGGLLQFAAWSLIFGAFILFVELVPVVLWVKKFMVLLFLVFIILVMVELFFELTHLF